jgi:hypothetical protein
MHRLWRVHDAYQLALKVEAKLAQNGEEFVDDVRILIKPFILNFIIWLSLTPNYQSSLVVPLEFLLLLFLTIPSASPLFEPQILMKKKKEEEGRLVKFAQNIIFPSIEHFKNAPNKNLHPSFVFLL